MLAEGVRWHDGWFAIEQVFPGIHAIGEPKYHQLNWSYLVEGKDFALMFDTGPGLHDIRKVAESLTALPLVAFPSHLHFDHTGNLHRFDVIAMADLPVLRACEREGLLHAPDDLYLGHWEDMVWHPVPVRHWWPPGQTLAIGDFRFEIIHTPGHSPDSIALLDRARNVLLAADFIYPGDLYAQVPGASLADYLSSAEALLPRINADTLILCAHGNPDEAGNHAAPRLVRQDIADLAMTLETIRASMQRPERTQVNDHLALLANEAAFAAWQSTE